MKGKFTKFRKLLCYVIISLFMFGIGGELVKADSITINSADWVGNYTTARYAKFNVTLNGTAGRYAYCLDAPLDAPPARLYPLTINSIARNDITAEQKLRMINVLLASSYTDQNGVLQYDYSVLGVNNELDAFYITQAALWYARYGGSATYRTFTPNFHKKMANIVDAYGTDWGAIGRSQGLGKYQAGYKNLMEAADSRNVYNVKQTKLKLDAENSNTMSETTIGDNNKVLVSNSTFSVSDDNNPKDTTYRVTVSGDDAYIYSEDLSTNYGTSKDFTENDRFKIVIDVDDTAGANTYDASFQITELNPGTTYDLEYFAGLGSWGFQTMTLLIPQGNTPSELNYSLKGETTVTEHDVPFAKVNSNGEYIDNAELEIYTSNGEFVTKLRTTSDGPRTRKLVPGDYYLKETMNPSGYAMDNDVVNFSIGSDGKITTGGEEVDIVRFTDTPAYIAPRKVDTEGNGVEGATIIIYAKHPGETDNYICGKTDSEGYLTQTSTACNNIDSSYGSHNIISSTGVYNLVDLNYSHFYSINTLYAKELEAPYGYELDNNLYMISGPLGDSAGWYHGPAGAAGDVISTTKNGVPVTEFQFKNNRYINISKVNSIGGEEVPEATLSICRKNDSTGECEVDVSPKHNKIYVDYWISEDEPHKFVGIEKNVRYILEEVYAPEGYVLFSGKLEFELVDDQGTVKMYNHSTGEEIDNPEKLKAVMPNEPTHTYVSKTSFVTGEEIAGAHLKICTHDSFIAAESSTGNGNNCTALVEWDSEAGKEKQIDALPANKPDKPYHLVETIAPEGYKMTNSVEFHVKDDGSINKVEFENKPIKVVISKKDQATGKNLAGAKFEILNAQDRTIAKDYNGNELVWTSDGENDWEILGIPAGEYILVETQRPEGFQEGMIIDGELVNEYRFTVSNQISELEIDAYIVVMNAPNTGISTLNLFAIGGLMVFAGYETIKIYRRKALNN